MERKIVWSIEEEDKIIIKDGTINGITFTKIWKQCQKESEEYYKKKFIKGVQLNEKGSFIIY